MKRRAHPHRGRQLGAALLTAMLTVTLVATFAAAALWQQWRAVEVEAAERARMQSAWVLVGALDWSRLILREDARAGGGNGADHLAEPWAVPLAEAKLSSFLSANKNVASDAVEGLPEAFLSGRIVDAQSKLNVLNLVDGGKPVAMAVAAFTKLFELLDLPVQEVGILTTNLQRALPASNASTPATAAAPGVIGAAPVPTTVTSTGDSSAAGPLLPQHVYQLVWLGLSPSTVAALDPYVTILPARTPLNINTASAEALFASVPALDLAGAKRLVAQRTHSYFRTVDDASALLAGTSVQLTGGSYSVSTSYFEVYGRLRIDRTWVEERSLLQRDGINVRIVWRERGAGATAAAPTP
ncbi:type II secretion system minor pseudopilin GspK [Variovorax sp. PBL-E5]|uniref:type II secretion system minor pseudopilin GspK n=1 Tax=Variovorax sp. PBL-E5 TaxID=434014 RepID=UPI001315DFEF|nr:type II secretion system minor pseudopilin GspK [Variovorax sp. PBL-E5]VTU20625.1 Type II secretory pathway, component PulK [Variovorax sp. PBL-E5]